MRGAICIVGAIALLIVSPFIFGSCDVSDELHLTGRQAGAADFQRACAPARVQSVAGDETAGLAYNVTCSDGRVVEVDDRLPK